MDIQIQLLQKRYGKAMVVNIPMLTLKQGELVGLVGNNGAGKTTLMRLILDLIEPTQGFVCSNGEKVNETEAWKHYTGSFIDGRFLIDPKNIFNSLQPFMALMMPLCASVWPIMHRSCTTKFSGKRNTFVIFRRATSKRLASLEQCLFIHKCSYSMSLSTSLTLHRKYK